MLSRKKKLALILLIHRRRKLMLKYRKRFWIHPLNTKRIQDGEEIKVNEMYLKYPDKFFEYTRMSSIQFDKLLRLVCPQITKEDTNYRKAITPRVRLYVTLRYLATGDSIRSIATSFSLGVTTVWKIVHETTVAIWEKLGPIYVKLPTKEDWLKIAEDFERVWQFPNCLGAIDGKHVKMEAPHRSGSTYFNYKGFFSLVLLATCDAHYRFTTIDVGAYGRQSDGGIFGRSALGKSLASGQFPFPEDRDVTGSPYRHPFVFVGDEAFSLSTFMMRPFPGTYLQKKERIFNYRLSRARRVIENVFGVLCNRFRIFKRSLIANPVYTTNIVKATVALHNFLRTEEMELQGREQLYCPPGFVDSNDECNGAWRNPVESPGALNRVANMGSNMHSRMAKLMRENLADYFLGAGSLSWQNDRAGVIE